MVCVLGKYKFEKSHVFICPACIIHSIHLSNLPPDIAADAIKKAVEEFVTFYNIRDQS
jgi:hypothetical protein